MFKPKQLDATAAKTPLTELSCFCELLISSILSSLGCPSILPVKSVDWLLVSTSHPQKKTNTRLVVVRRFNSNLIWYRYVGMQIENYVCIYIYHITYTYNLTHIYIPYYIILNILYIIVILHHQGQECYVTRLNSFGQVARKHSEETAPSPAKNLQIVLLRGLRKKRSHSQKCHGDGFHRDVFVCGDLI